MYDNIQNKVILCVKKIDLSNSEIYDFNLKNGYGKWMEIELIMP